MLESEYEQCCVEYFHNNRKESPRSAGVFFSEASIASLATCYGTGVMNNDEGVLRFRCDWSWLAGGNSGA